MARTGLAVVIALLMACTLAFNIINRSPNCRPDGAMLLKVGKARYRVPAWMDPFPSFGAAPPGFEKSGFLQRTSGFSSYCQSAFSAVVEISSFGFNTRVRSDRSKFPASTPSVSLASQFTPAVRPIGSPVEWRDISSISYGSKIISSDKNWALIPFTLHLKSGLQRHLEAHCLYGKRNLHGNEYIERCITRVPLALENALESNVNPGDNLSLIGLELIRSLRAVEAMSHDANAQR